MQKHSEAAFKIIGLQARTTNTREATPDGLIGKQWQRLFGEGLIARIPNRTDAAIVALYTDYAPDEHGAYTYGGTQYSYILGAKVSSCEHVPQNMVCRSVPAAGYITLLSERGAIPDIVVALWQKVWQSTWSQLGGARSFSSDYEIYDERAADRSHAQVELRLGVTMPAAEK